MQTYEISGDRVYDEVTKILATGSRGVNLLDEVGFISSLFPEVKDLQGIFHGPYHEEGCPYTHTNLVLDYYVNQGGNNPLVLWALLLHDIGKGTFKCGTGKFHGHEDISAEMSAVILEKMIGKNLSRKEAEVIIWLVENHMRAGCVLEMRSGKRGVFFANENFPLLLDVLEADSMGRLPQCHVWQEVREAYQTFSSTFKAPSGPSLRLLGVNGHTLQKELGEAPGPHMGVLLGLATEYLYENPSADYNNVINYLKEVQNA